MLKNPNSFQHKPRVEANAVVQDSMDHLRKMFIGGLSAVTTEESLRDFFGQWGEVVDAVVMRDPATKRSRGFGFISYADKSMVDKAQSARPHVIDGKTVDSKRALPRPELGKTESNSSVKKIFVGGLKENHDEQALTEHFSAFGNVVSVKILTDKATGRKRGFAFVEFDDYDAVDKAVLHKSHSIKFVLVDVKKSVYKQEFAKKFNNQPGVVPQPGSVPQTGATVAGYPQQTATAYNPHAVTPYGYPPQMPQAVGAYNGWTGYAATPPTAAAAAAAAAASYQQPPPAVAQAATAYGAYGTPQQNGAAAAAAWNTTAAYQTAWGQNGYGSATPIAAATQAAAVPTGNTWNGAQNFGDYQQTYNGGPQKAGSLQTNRVNPYTVASGPNYGTTAATGGYVNVYATPSNLSISSLTANTLPAINTKPTAISAVSTKVTRRLY